MKCKNPFYDCKRESISMRCVRMSFKLELNGRKKESKRKMHKQIDAN